MRGHVRRVSDRAPPTCDGRALRAVGEPVSRIVVNRHSFIDINSLVRWDIDGDEGWGEDQDMWPVHRFARDAAEGSRRRREPSELLIAVPLGIAVRCRAASDAGRQPQSPSSHQIWAIWWRPPKYTPGPLPPPGSTLTSTPLTCGWVMTPHSAQFSQRS